MKLAEWRSETVRGLTAQQISAISTVPALSIVPEGVDQWKISAKQFVGTVRLPDLTITIVPKIPVDRLMELLCESVDTIVWSKSLALYDVEDDLLSVIADSWCLLVERVLTQGLLQGYRSVDDALFGVRGRIRLADQISRRTDLIIPVEVTYDDYTQDVLENQLLAGACALLSKLPVARRTRKRLQRISRALVDVAPVAAQKKPPEPVWTRLNERYRGAVFLSQLVLSSSHLERTGHYRTQGACFLVDMNRVFENVVGFALKKHIEETYGGKALLQYSEQLDRDGLFKIRPDFVWKVDGNVKAVADFKYKQPAQKEIDISDVYQALAYCTKFRLDLVNLVYTENPVKAPIDVDGRTVLFDYIDIGSGREVRQVDIHRLATAIVRNS